MTPDGMAQALEGCRDALDALSMEDIAGLTKEDFGQPDISDGELSVLKGSMELLKDGVPSNAVLQAVAGMGSEKSERIFIETYIARGDFDVGEYDVSHLLEEPKLEAVSVCHRKVRPSSSRMIEELFMEELGKRRAGLDGMFYLVVHDRKTERVPIGYAGASVKLGCVRTLPDVKLHIVQLDGGEFPALKRGARSWLLRHELMESIVEENDVERQYKVGSVKWKFKSLPWYDVARNIAIDSALMVEDFGVAKHHFGFHRKYIGGLGAIAKTRVFSKKQEEDGIMLMTSLLTGCHLAGCVLPYSIAAQRTEERYRNPLNSYRSQLIAASKPMRGFVGMEYEGMMRVFEENLYDISIEGNRISDAICKRLYTGIDAFVKNL